MPENKGTAEKGPAEKGTGEIAAKRGLPIEDVAPAAMLRARAAAGSS